MLSGEHRHWQPALHTDWLVRLKNATFAVMIQKTAAEIEATNTLLPHTPNRLIPVGIPNPLLLNRLKSIRKHQDTPLEPPPQEFGQNFLQVGET